MDPNQTGESVNKYMSAGVSLLASCFPSSVQSNFVFALVCCTTLCDWLAKFAPLSQSMRNKTSRDSLARVFPRLTSVTRISNSDWLVAMFAVIGQSDYVGFGFMTLD